VSTAVVLVYGLTARLLAPMFPESTYFLGGPPGSQLGGITLGASRLSGVDYAARGEIRNPWKRAACSNGTPLHIEAIAGPQVRALGPRSSSPTSAIGKSC
jgi:hypothetical protein